MKLEPPQLLASRQEVEVFLGLVFLLFIISLLGEYRTYRQLTRFDDAVVAATVEQQYIKRKEGGAYQVLKLRSKAGAPFFITVPTALRDLEGYEVRVWLKTDRLDFWHYLGGFFAYGAIDAVLPQRQWKFRAGEWIESQHTEVRSGALFAALFTATPLPPNLRESLARLGISHLLAISGFHLGLLSLFLFTLLRFPYRYFQTHLFPWRNARRDLFYIAAAVLWGYALFLHYPPSVLRAFAMMLIGFILYDRGLRILSFQTLGIAVVLLIAFWPRLLFSTGFWLSVAGVFYIFLFLQRFADRGRLFTFVGIHLWVYGMMLPIALALFGTYSALHPLSVLWTMAFILFYPLALLLHAVGLGGVLDSLVVRILELPATPVHIEVGVWFLAVWIGLSLLALPFKTVKMLLPLLAAAVFVGAVYQVA
ncbi:ComEC/Rec2 family competence protein [Sulfurimonas sp. HSL-1656]|uniref:ComEC/Rec2 family competence protein n=1 Tax=Thiomicrolovo subterrani TaxID=3131934 RepID=UPI0031F8C207